MNQKKKKRVQGFESKKSIPRKVKSSSTNRILVDSKSLKNSTIPIDVSLGLKSFPTKSLNSVKLSLTGSKSNALLNNRSINVVHKELDSISAKEISLSSSPIAISPTVLSITTVMPLTPRYKTIFSSAALTADYRLASKHLERLEDYGVSKDIKSKPFIQLKTGHTKCLENNYFAQKTYFDNINGRPPLHNIVRASSACDDEVEKSLKVVKHVHCNAICLKGPEFIIKKKGLPLVAEITEGTFSNKLNATFYQETKKLNDNLTTNIESLSNLQVTSPNPVISLLPSSLNKFNNQDKMNDISFQESNYTSSSSTEDIKSVKRKRSS